MSSGAWRTTGAAALTIALTMALIACGNNNGGITLPPPGTNTFNFHTITNIGSIVDPTNGDQNPYGLAIAPATSGLLTAGDIVICNFNNSANVQGTGTTVEFIHPTPGSTGQRFAQGASLLGCGATAVLPDDRVAVTAKIANDVVIFTSSGATQTTFSGAPFNGPWGAAYANSASKPAIYVANANDGSLVRINVLGANTYSTETIATGFTVNGGAPGSIFAPYGMAYNPANDTLYIAETNTSKLVAIAGISNVAAGGIAVSNNDSTFGGPSGSSVSVVFSGSPLNNPLGDTLLANGNIVLVNSSDNVMSDISTAGHVAGTLVLDAGPAGALFSVAAATNAGGQQIVYFNDSNDGTVKFVGP